MRHAIAQLAAASVLLLAPTSASAMSDATRCPRARSAPSALGPSVAARTTLCLLNHERVARGLRPLRVDRKLSRAARGHARDMVARSYFAHESPSGVSFATRIKRTGWMRARRSWTVGENIAEGSGELASPQAVVSRWMQSSSHRANIQAPEFRVIGIGVALGTPTGRDGAT